MPAGIPTNHERISVLFDVSADTDDTLHFTLPQWATFVAVLIPDLTSNGRVDLHMSDDGGTTYYPVLDPADGADLVICAAGSDPGFVDISDFIRAFIPRECTQPPPTRFRFHMTPGDSDQDYTFYVFVRG